MYGYGVNAAKRGAMRLSRCKVLLENGLIQECGRFMGLKRLLLGQILCSNGSGCYLMRSSRRHICEAIEDTLYVASRILR